MPGIEIKSIGSSVLLVILFGLGIGLFGTGYGIVTNNISADTYKKIKDSINYIFGFSAVLVAALMVTSLILIRSDPSMFQPYILVVSHVTLLVALLSLSYSVLKITN
jgi:hypothetical protein